jgi:hypothetical protein
MKGHLDIMGPAQAVAQELVSIPSFGDDGDDALFAKEKKVLKNLKKAGLMVAGGAVQKLMQKLSEEQEVLMNLADMLSEGYMAESVILRVEKLVSMRGEDACQVEIDIARVFLHHAVDVTIQSGKEAIFAFAEGDEQRLMLMGLKRFTKIEPMNLKDARRRIADHVIEKNEYPF